MKAQRKSEFDVAGWCADPPAPTASDPFLAAAVEMEMSRVSVATVMAYLAATRRVATQTFDRDRA